MFVGAYWSERKESREQVAERLARFLSSLAAQSARFSEWFMKGRSRVAARTRLELEAASIGAKLRVNRRDLGGDIMPELGFSFDAWNGADVSLGATLGADSRYVTNSVVLSLAQPPEELTAETWKALLGAAVLAFDPQHAVVTSTEFLAKHGATNPWEAGWLTYERGGPVRQHP